MAEFKWHLRTAANRPLCGVSSGRHVPLDQVRLVTCERCLQIFAAKPEPTHARP